MYSGAAVEYAQICHSEDVCGPSGSPVSVCVSAGILQLVNKASDKIVNIYFIIFLFDINLKKNR